MRSPYGPERLRTDTNETETETGPVTASVQEEGAELAEHHGFQDRPRTRTTGRLTCMFGLAFPHGSAVAHTWPTADRLPLLVAGRPPGPPAHRTRDTEGATR